MSDDKKLDDILKDKLATLPTAVRNAITSADVEKGLRALADKHKLHLDQWQGLENEVMLALIGLEPIAKLEENIIKEVDVDAETARVLASDIAVIVFEPIRKELEKELGKPLGEEEETGNGQPASPDPQRGEQTIVRDENPAPPIQNTEYRIPNTIPAPAASMQTSAQKIIENAPPRPVEVKAVPPVASTPPAPAPTQKSVRAVLSPAYAPDTKSHERKTVDDDPYRESIT